MSVNLFAQIMSVPASCTNTDQCQHVLRITVC